MNRQSLPPDDVLLAEGFAARCAAWSRRAGTTEARLSHAEETLLYRICFALSAATSEGHVCLHLVAAAAQLETEAGTLRDVLVRSGIVGNPAAPGGLPIILDDDGRLYLHRYFDFERRLAQDLHARSRQVFVPAAAAVARLNDLFPPNDPSGELDWQKIAAALALIRPVTVISGGPGTGKTTTVVNILASLLAGQPDCRIALAAPTGKAAARMLDAVRARAAHLPQDLQRGLPEESFTVHRLLGVTPAAGVFRHDAANPIPYDALIVDEASMLDLALAVRLFDALPPHARIVLLGDKDQLAAVEAGAVFAELSANPGLNAATATQLADITGLPATSLMRADEADRGLRDTAVWFTRNYRFAKDSGIGRLATAIAAGAAQETVQHLRDTDGDTAIRWLVPDAPRMTHGVRLQLAQGFADYVAAVRADAAPAAVFAAFLRYRVLCAVRAGDWGVEAVNAVIAESLRPQLARSGFGGFGASDWYVGRPVIIRRNDYGLRLFNGDVGIALRDAEGELKVFFPEALDGSTSQRQRAPSEASTGFRAIAPARLPEHETAFAMTIHKSQGSEFDQVAVVLPPSGSRVLTRELLYTAVTRAVSAVTLVATPETLHAAIAARTDRESGLAARLRAIGAMQESVVPPRS